MKLLEILKFSEEYLKKYSFSKPRLESEKLISYVLQLDRITLYVYFDIELSLQQKEKIKEYLKIMARTREGFDKIKMEQKEKVQDFLKENQELLLKSIEYLEKNNIVTAKLDAEYIFSHVLNINRNILTMNLRKKIDLKSRDKIKQLLYKRGKERKPLQYLLGEWEFYGLPFKVDERVLIPRPDTEILVEQCKYILLDLEKPRVLEIGVGSGAISIALAKEITDATIFGVDISSDALEVAEENKKLNKIGESLKLIKSDLFSNIMEKEFNLIVSNPPYISQDEYEELMPEVKRYEPKIALTDGKDGLFFYKTITKEAKDYLVIGGFLAFEVGYNQAEEVIGIMKKENFEIVTVVKDYSGIDRVVIGRKSGEESVN